MSAVAGWPRVRWASGTIEALKWFAFACMVVDHVNAVCFGRELGLGATVLGRLAFPLFTVVLGYNLARPGADLRRVFVRLVVSAAIAAPIYAATVGLGQFWPANVMATFAAAVAVIAAWQRFGLHVAVGAWLVLGALVDGFWPGIALCVAAWAYTRRPDALAASAVAVTLLALCALQGAPWSLLALPVLWLATRVDVDVPRWRWAFYVAYPAHLVVLAGVGAAHG